MPARCTSPHTKAASSTHAGWIQRWTTPAMPVSFVSCVKGAWPVWTATRSSSRRDVRCCSYAHRALPGFRRRTRRGAQPGRRRRRRRLCGAARSGARGPVGDDEPRHSRFRRGGPVRNVHRGVAGRSTDANGVLAGASDSGRRDGAVTGSSSPAGSTRASRPRPTRRSTCRPPAPCRVPCVKAWMRTSRGRRAWRRTTRPTPGTPSVFRAPCIRSSRTRHGRQPLLHRSLRLRPLAVLDLRGWVALASVLGPLPGDG